MLPVPVGDLVFEFHTNASGIVEAVTVAVPVPDESLWPTITEYPEPGVRLYINIRYPEQETVQRFLRTLEGLLSLYGLKKIDQANPDIQWQPENEREKQALHVSRWSQSKAQSRKDELAEFPFDILARSVLSIPRVGGFEVALSFFRRGANAVVEDRFIESVYDFFFFFETLFADGKSRSAAVKREFKRAPLLIGSIQKLLSSGGSKVLARPKVRDAVVNRFFHLSPEDIVDQIVDLRGFLHHHASKRKGVWHPERQSEYAPEAALMQGIAYNVAFELTAQHVFGRETADAFSRLFIKGQTT